MEPPKKPGLMVQAAMQIVAGGTAGFVEVSLMHPLDIIKTRLQVQGVVTDTLCHTHRYDSITDCAGKMYKHEGFSSFYKGILPPILAETPKRAIKFFSFEQFKPLFLFGSEKPTAITFTLAGLMAGITESFVINPFEVVKIKLQTDRQALAMQTSTWGTARAIIAHEGVGLRGLNKGLTSTLGRHGVFNMVYFSFYHNVKSIAPKQHDPYVDLAQRFAIGFASGTLASCVNIPFDVAKSRIQGPQPVLGEIKYRTCLATMATVYREEGFRALYKGLVPKIMRLGPGGAIMLIVFDAVYEKLQFSYISRHNTL